MIINIVPRLPLPCQHSHRIKPTVQHHFLSVLVLERTWGNEYKYRITLITSCLREQHFISVFLFHNLQYCWNMNMFYTTATNSVKEEFGLSPLIKLHSVVEWVWNCLEQQELDTTVDYRGPACPLSTPVISCHIHLLCWTKIIYLHFWDPSSQ